MEKVDNEIWDRLECNECIFTCLNQALINTVGQSSLNQTIKAFLTAGFSKSIHYLLRKFYKSLTNSKNKTNQNSNTKPQQHTTKTNITSSVAC